MRPTEYVGDMLVAVSEKYSDVNPCFSSVLFGENVFDLPSDSVHIAVLLNVLVNRTSESQSQSTIEQPH